MENAAQSPSLPGCSLLPRAIVKATQYRAPEDDDRDLRNRRSGIAIALAPRCGSFMTKGMSQPLATPANVAALIPAYQEERHIRTVALAAKEFLPLTIVVDDGSTDRTSAEAKAAGVEVLRHEKNTGKGAAIKTGLRELLARQIVEFVQILDGDGQHLPQEIPRFLEAANAAGARMVVGNRMGDVREMPFVRKCTNRYMSWTISRVIGQRVPDTQCGFRLFHRSLAAEFLHTESSAFDFETEMLAMAARTGALIAAAPVSTVYGDEVSKIHPVQDTLKFFRLLKRLKREARQAGTQPQLRQGSP